MKRGSVDIIVFVFGKLIRDGPETWPCGRLLPLHGSGYPRGTAQPFASRALLQLDLPPHSRLSGLFSRRAGKDEAVGGLPEGGPI